MNASSSHSEVNLKNRKLAALLAFLLPGLGHAYQGRNGKALLYMICILGLYAVGFALGEGHNVYWTWVNPLRDPENFRLYYLGQFWIGLPAFPALIQATLVHYGHEPILNGFMAPPLLDPSMQGELKQAMEEVVRRVNELHTKYGGLKEIGDNYTALAGLLNILAIYDAYDGPAHRPEAEEPSDKNTNASNPPQDTDGRAAKAPADGSTTPLDPSRHPSASPTSEVRP